MDVEKSQPLAEHLPGFAELAAFTGSDHDLALYRRFSTLSSRNLLYLQGELLSLETVLKELDQKDQEVAAETRNGVTTPAGMDVLQAAKDWESFSRRSKERDTNQAAKMKVVRKIRKVMGEYQVALLRQSQVLNLHTPDRRILQILTDFFEAKRPFIAPGASLMNDASDIVALRPVLDQDRLSKLIQGAFGYFFRERRLVPPSWGDLFYFPEKGIEKLVSIVSVLLSAILLYGAIVGLAFVPPKDVGLRLGVIGGCTFIFAIIVGLLTNARRSELFGAVAAYSAVLVVFATSNVGQTSGD